MAETQTYSRIDFVFKSICVTSGGWPENFARFEFTAKESKDSSFSRCFGGSSGSKLLDDVFVSRGLNFVLFTDGCWRCAVFDTYQENLNSELLDFLSSIPDGSIVALAVCDEASCKLSDDSWKALSQIGCSRFGFRQAVTSVAIKGGEILLSSLAGGLLKSSWCDENLKKQPKRLNLSPKERAAFIQEGCCILRKIVDRDSAERAREYILGKYKDETGWKTFHETNSLITDLFNKSQLRDLVSEMLGEPVPYMQGAQVAIVFPHERNEFHNFDSPHGWHIDGMHTNDNGVAAGKVHNFSLLAGVILNGSKTPHTGNS